MFPVLEELLVYWERQTCKQMIFIQQKRARTRITDLFWLSHNHLNSLWMGKLFFPCALVLVYFILCAVRATFFITVQEQVLFGGFQRISSNSLPLTGLSESKDLIKMPKLKSSWFRKAHLASGFNFYAVEDSATQRLIQAQRSGLSLKLACDFVVH